MTSHSLATLKYIEPVTLRAWFKTGSSTGSGRFTVVDVRDYDHVGGHIVNSLHIPSGSLSSQLPDLLNKVKDFDDVVFHCALSQQRGPSAALKFLRFCTDDQLQGKNVWVLRGGFVKWQADYGEDETVTEGYQKDIWKYGF